MADLIDSMVMKVTLDAASFRAGEQEVAKLQKALREDANSTAQRMEASGKQAAMFFSDAKREALGLLGTLVGAGGLAAFAAKSTAALSELGREARNIGLTVQQLNAFQNVVQRNGGSAESATQSFKGFVDQMERLKLFGTNPEFQSFLSQVGGDRADTPMTAFMKFMRFVEQHRNDIPLIRQIGKGLGFDESLITTAIQIGSVSEMTRQLANETGRVATPEMVRAAQELQKAWFDLAHQAENTGNIVLTNLNGPLMTVLQTTTDLLAKNPEVTTYLTALVAILTTLGAVRISAGLMGLTGLAVVLARLQSLSAWFAAATMLKGDTAPDYGTPPGGAFFGENGAFAHWWGRTMPSWLGGNGPEPTADTTMTPAKRAFLDALSMGESGGRYDAKNPNSSAHGRYQFIDSTDRDVSQKTGIFGNDPASQDRKAWYLAATTYGRNTGRDLEADLRAGGRDQEIAAALNKVWPSLPGGSQQNTDARRWSTRIADAVAANRGQQIATSPTPIDPALRLRPGGSVFSTSNSSTSSTQIGDIHVHTPATDAAGIARDIRGAIDDSFTSQANRGLE